MTVPNTFSVSPLNSPVIPPLPPPKEEWRPSADGPWLTAILVGAFLLRAFNPLFNTASASESHTVLLGRSALAGGLGGIPGGLTETGSYLWPLAAALTDVFGELLALRLFAAALGMVAVFGVYRLGRELFGSRTGIVAAALFACAVPTIFASRLATSDAASLPLLALGGSALAQAVRVGQMRWWVIASLCVLASVMATYAVAPVALLLCVVALGTRTRGGVIFTALLAGGLAATVVASPDVSASLAQLAPWQRGASSAGSAEPSWSPWARLDVWVLAALTLASFRQGHRNNRFICLILFCFAVTVQLFDRHDVVSWSDAAYVVLFLAPSAATVVVTLVDRLSRVDRGAPVLALIVAAALLHASGRVGLLPVHGGIPFTWPNTSRVDAFLAPRLGEGTRVLVDNAALRYSLRNSLPQSQIHDPAAFNYQGVGAPASFARGVIDGVFDYVVLSGSDRADAIALTNAVRPVLERRYVQVFEDAQSETGLPIEIFERTNPPTKQGGHLHLRVSTPTSGQLVIARGASPRVTLVGEVHSVPLGSIVAVDVLTDKRYVQARIGPLLGTELAFQVPVRLEGQGPHRCQHEIRVRVTDLFGRLIDEVIIENVRRATSDSLNVACPQQ